MFPSVGYFDSIKCPFFFLQSCPRPYCHFQHAKDPVPPLLDTVGDLSMPSTSSGTSALGDWQMPSTSSGICYGTSSSFTSSEIWAADTSQYPVIGEATSPHATTFHISNTDTVQYTVSSGKDVPISDMSVPYAASFEITNNDNALCTVRSQAAAPCVGAFQMSASDAAQFMVSGRVSSFYPAAFESQATNTPQNTIDFGTSANYFQIPASNYMQNEINEDSIISSPDAKFSSDDDDNNSVSNVPSFKSLGTLINTAKNAQSTTLSSNQRVEISASVNKKITGNIKTHGALSGNVCSEMTKSNCMLKPQVTSSAYSIPSSVPQKSILIPNDTPRRKNKKRRESATSTSSNDSSHKKQKMSVGTNDSSSKTAVKEKFSLEVFSGINNNNMKKSEFLFTSATDSKTSTEREEASSDKVLNETHNESKIHVHSKEEVSTNKEKIHLSSCNSKSQLSKHDGNEHEPSHKHEHSRKQNSSKLSNEKTIVPREKKRQLHSKIQENETHSKSHSKEHSINHTKLSSSSHHRSSKDSRSSHDKSHSRESNSSQSKKSLKESSSSHSKDASKESVSDTHPKQHSKHSSSSHSRNHHSKERSSHSKNHHSKERSSQSGNHHSKEQDSHSKSQSRESNSVQSRNSSKESSSSRPNNHKKDSRSSRVRKHAENKRNAVDAKVTNSSDSENRQEKNKKSSSPSMNLDDMEVDEEAVAAFFDNEFLLFDLGEVDEMFNKEIELEKSSSNNKELDSTDHIKQNKKDVKNPSNTPLTDVAKVDQKSSCANKSPNFNVFPEKSNSNEYSFSRGKKRIAHVPNVSLILNAKTRMEKEMKKQDESKPCTNTPQFTLTVSPATSNTLSPSAERTPSTSINSHRKVLPTLKSPYSRGIVLREKRQKYLYSLFQEYGKYTTSSEAITLAEDSEYEAYSGASSSNVYCCRIANCIKRIRQSGGASSEITSFGKTGSSASGNKDAAGKNAKFYDLLSKYILDDDQLTTNGYPRPHPTDTGVAVVQPYKKPFFSSKPLEKICCRCGIQYRVDEHGYQIKEEECTYHYGHLIKMRMKGALESRYWCCKSDHDSVGCATANCHVFEDYDPNYLPGFVTTYSKNQIPSDGNYGVFALDCEMVYTTAGLELARVTVVNPYRETVFERLVKPEHEILDYNTRFSGLKEELFENVTTTINDVQSEFLNMFSDKTILVGHSLDSDLKALKIIHNCVVDTSVMFPHRLGSPYKRSLKNLAQEILRRVIQEDVGGHDSAEDAVAAMDLVCWRIAEDSRFTLTT